jgi:hypothetical protein
LWKPHGAAGLTAKDAKDAKDAKEEWSKRIVEPPMNADGMNLEMSSFPI